MLEPVPFQEQVEDLIQSNATDEAHALLTQSLLGADEETKAAEFRDFHIAAAKVAFQEVRVDEAFEHFGKAGAGSFDPREILQFFPSLVESVSAETRAAFTPKHLTPSAVFGTTTGRGDITAAVTALRERQAAWERRSAQHEHEWRRQAITLALAQALTLARTVTVTLTLTLTLT